ncbi:MAG: PadR family transcriptional regulator, partial [Chloroflexi bacterium]|nr:PadR family transcriptional regulator [Chloroflexota bacterium]
MTVEPITRPRVERGLVQRALLALLVGEPRHGYELHGLFLATVGGHWELNTGQIYSSIERLTRDGLVIEVGVERGGGPDKRLWAITDEGRAELLEWFRSAVPRDYRLRDELYVKLMLAITCQAEEPYEVVQVQRRELFRELHSLTAARNALDQKRELPRILLLDGAIMHTEAELRWLDMIEA